MNDRVIDGDATRGHHLFKISQARAVRQTPPETHYRIIGPSECLPLNIFSLFTVLTQAIGSRQDSEES